jgi:hypothetical protein
MFDSLLDTLEGELRTALNVAVTGLVATARMRLEDAVAEIEEERAKGLRLAEVAQERATNLEVVDATRRELHRVVEAMHTHQEQQEGCVELNIGGYRFQTSVQTLRRVPHTFFDAYFSGRYAQDVCNDGSIFVDRDGEYFGHVLEYMRDGVVSVAGLGARPSVSSLRALKRELGFYCIELSAEQPAEPDIVELAYAVGGSTGRLPLSSMERYDASSGQWNAAAAMGTARTGLAVCTLAGELYAIGGRNNSVRNISNLLATVERYSPSSDTWSAVTRGRMSDARVEHAAVAVGSAIYVLGGHSVGPIANVLKFDSTQGTWSEVAPMPQARDSLAVCMVGSDIYVPGDFGQDDEIFGDQVSVLKFDTVANVWSTVAPTPVACSSHSVSVLRGLVYVVGAGREGQNVLRFDPANDVWITLAPTLTAKFEGCSFVLDGCLYAVGGSHRFLVPRVPATVERYDVVKNTWTSVADMLQDRLAFGAVTIRSAVSFEEQNLFDSLIADASE